MLVHFNTSAVFQSSILPDKKRNLSMWGNDQVSKETLVEIVTYRGWHKLNDIEGYFSGVNKGNQRISLFCDRLGLYPLYYSTHNNTVFVAPSIVDLLDTIPFKPTPSIEGVLSLLLFGHHLADEMVFKEIKRVEGGVVIEFANDTTEISPTQWRKPHTYNSGSVEDDIEDRLAETFVRGVECVVEGHDKIIIPLSSGFDSRAVLGAALECMEAKHICCVTFGGEDTFDFQIGRMVARKAGAKSIAFPITDQIFEKGFQRQRASAYAYGYSPFATQPPEMMSYLAQEASKGHRSVWGVGGDAITGSHLHSSDFDLKPCGNFDELARLLIRMRSYVPLKDVTSLLGIDEREAIHIIAGLLERSSLDRYERSWQFLDAWDIFVRGRMELISVLPLSGQLWRCPHFGREYFDLMAIQGFDEKIHQNVYRRLLSSRYKSLFGLPTKRLGGKALVGSKVLNLYWTVRWKAGDGKKVLRGLVGIRGNGVCRNYGEDHRFLSSIEGRERLRRSIDILMQQGIMRQDVNEALELVRRNKQVAHMVITLGYAFNQ